MSSSSSKEPGEKTFMSEAPWFVKFFLDEERPIALRGGIGAILLVIFLLPLFTTGSSRRSPQPVSQAERIPLAEETSRAPADPPAPDMPLERAALRGEESDLLARDRTEPRSEPPKETEEQTGILRKINSFPVPIAIAEDPQGDVWTTTVQDVTEFRAGSLVEAQVKLSPTVYENLYNNEFPLITASFVDAYGDIWLGARDGQIMRYNHSRYDWKIAWESNEPIRDHILAITRSANLVFVGTIRGLWKWDLSTGKLTRFKGFQGTRISALYTTQDGDVFLGSDKGIWKLTARGWEQFFAVSAGQPGGTILHLTADSDGNLLAGTARGLLRLSAQGVPIQRLLTSQKVTAVRPLGAGKFLLGSEKGGLAYYDGKSWFGRGATQDLPGDFVHSIFLDRRGQAWLGITGKGIYTQNADRLIEWLKLSPLSGADEDEAAPKEYPNACKAALTELKKVRSSGEISIETIDGRPLVFFRGRLVCPSGTAYRHENGTTVLVHGSDLTRISGTDRQSLSLPSGYPVDQIRVMLVDSHSRIWLGLPNGPLMFKDRDWSKPGEHDPTWPTADVQSIAETSDGSIWVGTAPVYSKNPEAAIPPNLFKYSNGAWTSFGVNDWVPGWVVSALTPLRDGRLAIGTSNGFGFLDAQGNFERGLPKDQKMPPAISLTEDPDGAMWLTHGYMQPGVTKFAEGALKTYDNTHGLKSDRVSTIAHDEAGRHWMLSSRGTLNIYTPTFFETPPGVAPSSEENWDPGKVPGTDMGKEPIDTSEQ